MSAGMFTEEQNRDRLHAIDCALRHDQLRPDDRELLETTKAEIEAWLIYRWSDEQKGV